MVIALAASAVLFLIGFCIMMRSEERCMKRNDGAAQFARKRR
jgi:hypothetical protein